MTHLRPLAALFALSLTLALPAFAQDAATGTDGTAAPAEQVGGDPSLGKPATPAPTPLPTAAAAEVGQTYLSETFDSWELRCRKTGDGADPCLLFQLLKDATGNPVSEISFFALPAGGEAVAGANVVVPLETLLTRNLGMTIDGEQSKVYPFVFCTRAGCVSKVGLVATELDAMKKGAKAQISIVPAAAPDKVVTLDVSLKGFTAGFEAVSKTTPAN